MQAGIAGNVVRWVDSFLSDRQAMLAIDGRTGHCRIIKAGLPQGSPASPVLFMFSISAMFQWPEDRHPTGQALSFVDHVGLVIESEDLVKGTRNLERIAGYALRWKSESRVEFEVSKTEALLFSRLRKALDAAKNRTVDLADQSLAVKQGATKWRGFWLDPELSWEQTAKRERSPAADVERYEKKRRLAH